MVQIAGIRVGRVRRSSWPATTSSSTSRGRPRRRVRRGQRGVHRGAQPARGEVPRPAARRAAASSTPRARSRWSAPTPATTSSRSSPSCPTPPRASTPQLQQALATIVDDAWTRRAARAGDLRGLSRLSATIASRDREIQSLLERADSVSQAARRPQGRHRRADQGRRPDPPGAAGAQGGDPRPAAQHPRPCPPSSAGWSTTTRSRSARCCASCTRSPSCSGPGEAAAGDAHNLGPYAASSATSSAPGRGSTPTPSTSLGIPHRRVRTGRRR